MYITDTKIRKWKEIVMLYLQLKPIFVSKTRPYFKLTFYFSSSVFLLPRVCLQSFLTKVCFALHWCCQHMVFCLWKRKRCVQKVRKNSTTRVKS